MPRSGASTRKRILECAYALFRRKGYSRVNVDEIALASKVTKRTLYYHFKSKDDLFAAMFEAQHELALIGFSRIVDKLVGSPEQIVDGVFRELEIWSSKPNWPGSGFTRVVIELADLPGHPARVIAKRHKATIEARFAEILAKAGIRQSRERAREFWLLCEGAMVLILMHGDRSYAKSAARAAKALLKPGRKGAE